MISDVYARTYAFNLSMVKSMRCLPALTAGPGGIAAGRLKKTL